MRTLKILIASVDFFPNIGGVSLMTHNLANAFSDLGHDITLLAPGDISVPKDYTVRYKLHCDYEADKRRRSGYSGFVEGKRIKKILSEMDGYDYVLLMHPFYYGFPILDFYKKTKSKVTCFFHGFEFRSQLIHNDKFLSRCISIVSPLKSLRASTLHLAKYSDYVFVNSSETRYLVNQVRSDPIYITGCGIDLQQSKVKIVAEKNRASFKTHAENFFSIKGKVIGFVGRLVVSKNVHFLIDLLKFMPGVNLIIVGDGPERKRLENLAKANQVDNRVLFLGSVSEDEKWLAIDLMDLLVLPSVILPKGQIEGFGIVMLEAALRRVPIAVSQFGGMKDFILENNGAYLDIGNIKGSASKVIKMMDDSEKAMVMADNAQRLLMEKLTYDKIALSMMKLWEVH